MNLGPDPAQPGAAATALGDGVYRIELPLPFPSPRAVNCYLFEGDRGLTLLDCGIDGPAEFEMLTGALAGFDFAVSDLERLVGSHLHVDHMGMAKRIVDATGCDWVMHTSTESEIPHYNDWSPRRNDLARLVAASGAPPEAVARFDRRFERPAWFSEALDPTHPVEDGDHIRLSGDRHLEAIFTPGHQANHLCLRDSRTGRLYSGDHVLPRISPFIPYTGEGEDHLGAYLASLQRIIDLDAGETYPGHGPTIERGSARAHQIYLHHQRRMETLLGILKEGARTPWAVMQSMFRSNLSSLEQRLAFQETMAHLEHLRLTGRLERNLVEGRLHYRRQSSPEPE